MTKKETSGVQVENIDNPHLKLAKMGAGVWNRWARTLMDDGAIDGLRLSDEKKQELKRIRPLNDEEQNELAGKLGLSDLGELDHQHASFKGMEIECEFKAFWFPVRAIFIEATFNRYANFSEATFSGIKAKFNWRSPMIETTYNKGGSFFEVIFGKGLFFDESAFSESASFIKTTFSKGVYFREATFSWVADFIF